MKKLKRMLAVLLTAIMMLAMATTAFAADSSNKGSLKVTVNEGNTLKGQTIKVYKLFDLTVSGNDKYAYTVNETYKSAIAKALELQDTATSEELYKKLVEYKENSTEIQKFADDFTAAALNQNLDATQTSSGSFEENTKEYTFSNLDFGYYLVYQTGTKELQSSLVSVDKAEASVNLKGEAPSIEKTADNETVEIGQVVTYTITGVIPDTTGYEQYTYKIHDTLTAGLDFVKDADGTAVDDKNVYPVSVKIGVGEATSKTAALSGNNNRTMTLDLSQWIRDNQASKGQEFTVTYYAKVNANAVVTEKNSAELEYGNNPENTTTTTPSEAKTPTYPLQIHKYEKDKVNEYLAGATFRLYNSEEDANKDQNPIAVTGSDGNYTVDPVQAGDNKKYDMVSVGSELADPNKGMNLRLNGLKAGVYWLMETQAPDGYNGVTAPIKITIAKSQNDNVNDWIITKGDGQEETDKVIDIENTTGTILPGTGGMGTVLFTVIGVALVLIIAASFVISRRKRAE